MRKAFTLLLKKERMQGIRERGGLVGKKVVNSVWKLPRGHSRFRLVNPHSQSSLTKSAPLFTLVAFLLVRCHVFYFLREPLLNVAHYKIISRKTSSLISGRTQIQRKKLSNCVCRH